MSKLPRVVVTDLIPEPLECERRVLNSHADVVALNIKHQAELDGQLDDADAVMIYHYLRLDSEQIERLRNGREDRYRDRYQSQHGEIQPFDPRE